VLPYIGLCVALALGTWASLIVDRAMTQPEPTLLASQWIADRVPSGSRIAVILPMSYSQPTIDDARYQLDDLNTLSPDNAPDLIVGPLQPFVSIWLVGPRASWADRVDYSRVGDCHYQRVTFSAPRLQEWISPLRWYVDDWTYTFGELTLWRLESCAF
jgi:hypothetical protein